MARRRTGPKVLEFELLPDGDEHDVVVVTSGRPEGDDDAPVGIAPSAVTVAARRTWAWLRTRSSQQLVGAAVVVAITVVGGVAVHGYREQERVARISAAPGGVVDLSRGPGEAWAADLHQLAEPDWAILPGFGPSITAVLGDGTLVARFPTGELAREETQLGGSVSSLDGVTVVGGNPALTIDRQGWGLVALDVETGERLWTHHLDTENPWCTTTPHFGWGQWGSGGTQAQFACLTGEGEETMVEIFDRTGEVTTRPVAVTDEHTDVVLGPAGQLWLLDRVERPLSSGTVELGPVDGGEVRLDDVRVRAQDLVDGNPLWETVLPAGVTDPDVCTLWHEDGTRSTDLRWVSGWSMGGHAVSLSQ